jgi:hypothetical protein
MTSKQTPNLDLGERPRTDYELEKYLREMREFLEDLVRQGPEACRQFLYEAGICTKTGRLRSVYR